MCVSMPWHGVASVASLLIILLIKCFENERESLAQTYNEVRHTHLHLQHTEENDGNGSTRTIHTPTTTASATTTTREEIFHCNAL